MSRELVDGGAGDVGDDFADGHARGGSGVGDGERCALADGHRFAGEGVEGAEGDGAVGDGNLPGADHLILHGEAADAAVADGDEEVFGGDGGEAEQALDGVGDGDVREVERLCSRDGVRVKERCIFGGLPKRSDCGRSMGCVAPSGSLELMRTISSSAVARPTTAKGQRSRVQMDSKSARCSGGRART